MTDPACFAYKRKSNEKREKDTCSTVMEERGCPDTLVTSKARKQNDDSSEQGRLLYAMLKQIIVQDFEQKAIFPQAVQI